MKTFKLISMQLADDDALVDIEMEDGLIINKEDEKGTWLVEVFADHKYIPFFQDACDTDKEIIVHVVITKRENDPAAFLTKVCCVKKLKTHASILLTGKLTKPKSDYPEKLLEYLLDKGYKGEELLTEFKKKIIARPQILQPKNV
ncbi:hypothetical protein G3A_23880 [Bacillus sp. 17376]|uniref:YwpF protein n=1 Tax=Mesobacillus boroniphilus JCM 21738 TaxID=1294265 RepID=W4RVV6_9BACI|nr:YwpF family protein [Mesobacillus boroniphilus]ESU30085.1 hypothetical protein G3A_23880 [Bacillus sp. 17376]GAE48411.1 hypothetical protein JCM21738_5529 [Mesobacillus boroniphilus JCM 21738]